MKGIVRSTVLLLAAVTIASEGAESRFVVRGSRVNVRARPEQRAEVVGQLNEGDTLAYVESREPWIGIRPPEELSLWVFGEFVNNGLVTANKLNIRSGAGVNYTVVGTLHAGDKVRVRESFGDWVGIDPPKTAVLWVHSDYVEHIRPPEPLPVLDPPELVLPTEDDQPVFPLIERDAEKEPNRAPPPMPDELNLIPLSGQGKEAEYRGILKETFFLGHPPTAYRLIKKVDERLVNICYVKGNHSQLKKLKNVYLIIKGREYWVQGDSLPVIVPERITPRYDSLR